MPLKVVRIFKSWGAADERNYWVNNYEFDTQMVAGDDGWNQVILDLTEAEAALHLTPVIIWKATVSTYEEDSVPYNPLNLRSFPLNVPGARTLGTNQALDSNICYYVRKAPAIGRYGKLFYRGVLTEEDTVVAGDLSAELASNSPLTPSGAVWQAYRNKMEPYLASAAVGGLAELSMIYTNKITQVTNIRGVQELIVGGVVINRRNHRYFDRASA